MTFTYDLADGFSNLERVRFHIGDTDSTAAKFSDEEILAVIADQGTYQKAVIACIRNLIARMSVPTFQADWLRVDTTAARQGYERLLAEKRREFGLGVTTGTTAVYRADSQQLDEPDYGAGV